MDFKLTKIEIDKCIETIGTILDTQFSTVSVSKTTFLEFRDRSAIHVVPNFHRSVMWMQL